METKQLLETVETVLKEVLPNVVDATLEAKTAEKFSAIEKSLAEVNKSIKLWTDADAKEADAKAKEYIGKFFKSYVKGKQAFETFQSEVKAPLTYMNETVDAQGAYLVPIEFAKEVFRVAGNYGLARKYSRIIPMSTDTKDISALTNDVVVYWTDEGVASTESMPTFDQVQLVAYKATALISATRELIDDQMTDQEIRTLMSELIAEKIAEFEDTNVLVTSSKFTAILASTATNITTMSNSDDSFADITYDYLIDVMRSVPMKYKTGTPRWFMSQDIVKYIEKLKDKQDQPIFFSTRDLRTGQLTNVLLGAPLEISDVMPDDTDDGGSTKFVIFGDLKFRAFWDRKQLTFDMWYMSGNREKGIESFKANERIAGKIIFAKAFGVLKTWAWT